MIECTAFHESNVEPSSTSPVIHGDEIADLAALLQTSAQLVTVPLPWTTQDVPEMGTFEHWTRSVAVHVNGAVSEEQLEGLAPPSLESGTRFLSRLAFAATVFADLIGAKAVGVRVRLSLQPQCPRFHADHVMTRAVWVASGPGTQWLEDQAADRSYLGHQSGGKPDAESGLIRDPNGIHQVGPNRLAVFKGTLWPGNEGRGVIHRSPSTNGQQPRLVATFDWLDAD